MSTAVQVAHTADLEAAVLATVRALLVDVFEGDWTDADWDHTLGGMHALVWEGAELVGHGAAVQRRLLHEGRALRTGYVEGVAVRADRQRRGHGGRLMAAIERVLRRGYDLGALSATDEAVPLYTGRGWRQWQGPTSAFTPAGIESTPDDDGGLYVFGLAVPLDPAGELTCDWRDGDLW